MKLKNPNGVKTKNVKVGQNSKCDITFIVTKLKLWQNSNCEKKKTHNSKFDKTQIVTKLENSNYEKT